MAEIHSFFLIVLLYYHTTISVDLLTFIELNDRQQSQTSTDLNCVITFQPLTLSIYFSN